MDCIQCSVDLQFTTMNCTNKKVHLIVEESKTCCFPTMLRATLAFIFCYIALAKTRNENCNRISQTFYQTENKWYDLGCSESGKVQSNQNLAYQ